MASNKKALAHKSDTDRFVAEEPMVVLGRVVSPHGIRGQVKVAPFTEHIDGLLDYPDWWLGRDGKGWQIVHPVSSFIRGDRLVVTLTEYSDRTGASELSGLEIAVPKSELPQLLRNGEDGYYWSDLIGAAVFNMRGEALGNVTGLLETGANDVLQVCFPGDREERLIPFIEQIVMRVDLELHQITVDWELDY